MNQNLLKVFRDILIPSSQAKRIGTIVGTKQDGGFIARTSSGAEIAVYGIARIGDSVLFKGRDIENIIKRRAVKRIYIK